METKRQLARLLLARKRIASLWPTWDAGTNAPQAAFAASPAKYRAFNGGYGAGKTFVGSATAWETMRAYPGSLGLIVAPTYPELRDYTQRTFFEAIGVDADTAETHPLIAKWSKTEQHLRLINGSEVLFRSADKPSSLVGSTIDWFWLDEPASCAGVTWKHLLGRLRGDVGPRRGWCTGTPQGRNWVYREFAETQRANYALITGSSHDNACHLPPDYLESLTESYVGAFARANIFGEFCAFEGQVYQFGRDRHVLADDWEPHPDIAFDRSADFGVNNPTAWLWIQECAGTVYIFDELEVRRQPVDVIADEVRGRWPALTHGGDYGDVAGTQRDSNLQSYVSNYSREGIHIHTRGGGPVRAGIEVVSRYLAAGEFGVPRLMVHPRCTRLMSAFETYRWPEDKDGSAIGDDPVKDGVSDHLMDALRYWFVNRHPEQFRRVHTSADLPATGGHYAAASLRTGASALPVVGSQRGRLRERPDR